VGDIILLEIDRCSAAPGWGPYICSAKQAKVNLHDNTSKVVPSFGVADWSFLTTHAWALLLIANDPDARLRDIAASLDVTERTAHGLVADLTKAGYVVKTKDGRRNRYAIQEHLPLPDPIGRERTIGEVLELLRGVR